LNRKKISDAEVQQLLQTDKNIIPQPGGCTIMLELFKEGKKRYIIEMAKEDPKAQDPLSTVITKYENHPNFRSEVTVARKLLKIWNNFFITLYAAMAFEKKVSLHKRYLKNVLSKNSVSPQQEFCGRLQSIFCRGWPQDSITDKRFDGIVLEGYPDVSEELFVRTAAWIKAGENGAFPFLLTDYICLILARIEKGYEETKGGRTILPAVTCEKQMTTKAIKRRM
jgi:hypothetical protein